MGARAASESLRSRLSIGRGMPDLVISTGFAGSLSARMKPGDWIVARELRGPDRTAARIARVLEPVLRQTPLAWKEARLQSVSAIVTRREQGRLGAWADAVDMESWALFEIAADYGIPFQTLRLISDSPAQPVPDAVRSWAQGRALRGLGEALRKPGEVARFIARASRFPGRLIQGWREIAQELRSGHHAIRPSFSSDSGSGATGRASGE
jgi:hypothetical protein